MNLFVAGLLSMSPYSNVIMPCIRPNVFPVSLPSRSVFSGYSAIYDLLKMGFYFSFWRAPYLRFTFPAFWNGGTCFSSL